VLVEYDVNAATLGAVNGAAVVGGEVVKGRTG
jgi:hypothetical protein